MQLHFSLSVPRDFDLGLGVALGGLLSLLVRVCSRCQRVARRVESFFGEGVQPTARPALRRRLAAYEQ